MKIPAPLIDTGEQLYCSMTGIKLKLGTCIWGPDQKQLAISQLLHQLNGLIAQRKNQ